MSASFICAAIIIGAVFVAAWEEEIWKTVALLLVATIAVTGLRVSEYKEGLEDGGCIVYRSIDARPDIELHNIPERCN